MTKSDYQRVVLLNRLLSLSASRAPNEHRPPLHPGEELLRILEARVKKGTAVEYLGLLDNDNEAERAKSGAGATANTIRLRKISFEKHGSYLYAGLLIEYVDQTQRSFPVVHLKTFEGREISGHDEERGATSSHVLVRLPSNGAYDDKNYRCAFEHVPPINRLMVERFLSRQLKRQSDSDEWTFGVMVTPKGKSSAEEKMYRYHPKIHLVADMGRKFGGAASKTLTQMVFTKRSEKQAIGQPTSLVQHDVYADVEIKVSAKNAPTGEAEKTAWFSGLRKHYETLGYETKLYFRHAAGGLMGGGLHHDVANAADVMMCQKEIITLSSPPKKWRSDIDKEVFGLLRPLLDRDELWQRVT